MYYVWNEILCLFFVAQDDHSSGTIQVVGGDSLEKLRGKVRGACINFNFKFAAAMDEGEVYPRLCVHIVYSVHMSCMWLWLWFEVNIAAPADKAVSCIILCMHDTHMRTFWSPCWLVCGSPPPPPFSPLPSLSSSLPMELAIRVY